jgi:fumarate reductase flavoprotein subunit
MDATTRPDVAIVGAGLAGLTAANRLIQRGRRVVVLERGESADYLCNSRIASGSFNLAHSDPTADPETLREAIMGDTEGAADPALASAIAATAGPAMTWFRCEGAKFIKINRPGKAAANWSMAPPRPAKPGFGWQGRGPDVALRALARNFTNGGGVLVLGTRATRLLMSDGRCVGVATAQGGTAGEVRVDHVILADGGFQGNRALVRRFISPQPDRLVQRNAQTGQGDALLMAEEAGARLTGTDRFYGHLLVQEALRNDLLWPYPTVDTLASSAIVVDRTGRRFLDEGMGGVTMANRIAQLDDPLSATTIFDHAIWESAGRLEFTPPNPHLVECGGTLTVSGSLAELARAIDVPADALADTVARYNRAVQSGDVSELQPGRTPGRMFGVLRSSEARTPLRPILEPPFYAIRLCAGITYTMGGIAIDAQARARATNGEIIPGLYAAGACTGGAEGGPMAGYIGGLCKALTLGFIAAETIGAETPAHA